jgi:hypothetical protein
MYYGLTDWHCAFSWVINAWFNSGRKFGYLCSLEERWFYRIEKIAWYFFELKKNAKIQLFFHFLTNFERISIVFNFDQIVRGGSKPIVVEIHGLQMIKTQQKQLKLGQKVKRNFNFVEFSHFSFKSKNVK